MTTPINRNPEFDCTADIDDFDGDFDFADVYDSHELYDDGQPSTYEEYQDLWDGDDNFRDWECDDGGF